MSDKPEISEAEWQVMNVIWEKQPVTASGIINDLKGHDWTPATIRTFLHRLVKKGVLKYETVGNRYVYRAAVTRNSTIKRASKWFLQTVFAGETAPLLAHFVKSQKLGNEEIEQLKQLLDEKESSQ